MNGSANNAGGNSPFLENNGIVTDSSFNNQLNNSNKLTAAIVSAINALTTALNAVAVVPAPSYGAVGTYVFAKSSAAVSAGNTISGASLTPSDASGTASASSPAGTWRAMGAVSAAGQVSLFVRVS